MDRASYVCFGPKYSLFLQMSRELRDLHNQKTQPGNTNHFTGVTSNEQLTKYFRARLVRSLLHISKTTKSRLSFGLLPMHGLSFKARRSKLCMQPPFMRALVLGRSRPASAASEAVSWYVLFGVSKNHRRKRFWGSWLKSKVAQRPRFRGTGWPQIQPPRPSEAKKGKSRDFTHIWGRSRPRLQSDLRGRSRLWPQIRPPRPSEAVF